MSIFFYICVIDELILPFLRSWLLKVGTDHVVEQVINPKIHQYFLPKIIEVVHQYVKEQNELSNKKSETASTESASSSEKTAYETADSKTKTSISGKFCNSFPYYLLYKIVSYIKNFYYLDSENFMHLSVLFCAYISY